MQEKITREELTAELKAAIGDVFVAEITEKDGRIELRFVNGQKFAVSVEKA